MTTILQEAAAGRVTIVPWTVEQYHRAIETGFVPDRAKAGEDPMTVGDRHRIAVLRLARLAPAFERFGCFLQTQQPITLPPINEPEPDGAVIRGGIDDYLDHPPRAEDVVSVIEIADSSRSIDLGPKLTAYAAAGIPQYIVADLVNNRVLLHERPTADSYQSITTLERGDTLQISAGIGAVPIAVDRLVP